MERDRWVSATPALPPLPLYRLSIWPSGVKHAGKALRRHEKNNEAEIISKRGRLSKKNQGMFAPQYTVPLEGPWVGWGGIIAATVSEPHACI